MGKIVIKLDNYLKEHKISRSGLVRESGIRYDTLLSYCNSEVTRFDGYTLVRLCDTLGCKLEDIIEYIPD